MTAKELAKALAEFKPKVPLAYIVAYRNAIKRMGR